MNVGTMLQTARERQGTSLPQLAATTKIPVSLLRAIEENDFDKVPPGIFVRSFIRTYAAEVGISGDAAVEQFLSERAPEPALPPPSRRDSEQPDDDDLEFSQIDADLTESGPGWGYVLIVAALLVALVSMNRYTHMTSDRSADPRTTAITAPLS